MNNDKQAKDPISEVVYELCPNLDERERKIAVENLRRYMALVARMAERIARETMEREASGSPHELSSRDSRLPDIPW